MTVLVTGANGFLGRHLLGALFEAKLDAVALVRRPKDWPDWRDETGDVKLLEGSPLQAQAWQAAAKKAGVRTLIHTAGIVRHTRSSPDEMTHVNVEGTLQVVRAAQAIGARVVFISSSGTVGCYAHGDLVADEHAPYADDFAGRWPYYASKIRAEREGARLAEKLGVSFSIARLPVLLGPRDHRFRSTGHVARVLDKRVPFIPPGGMHFVDVRDVAAALGRLSQRDTLRAIYHFPGHASSLGDFFGMVSEVSGVPVTTRRVPSVVLNGVATITEGMTRRLRLPAPHWLPDPVVLEMAACHWGLTSLWTATELGYASRPARQTLIDTVTWLRANEEVRHASSHAA